MVVGRLLSNWEGDLSGAVLNFGRVYINDPVKKSQASTTLCFNMWAVAEASPPKSGFPQQTTEPSAWQ